MPAGGVGGATEALEYFIKAYDMATPVFRAFGAEVESVTKQVQASLAELNKALVKQGDVVKTSADEQTAAMERVKAAQKSVAEGAASSAETQSAAAKKAAAADQEAAAAATRSGEAQARAADTAKYSWWTAQSGIARTGRILAAVYAGAGLASLDFAAKFQANTLRMQTQAGATTQQLAKIREGLLSMAGQVGSTPDQLATGMYHVVSAMNAVIPPQKRVSVELGIMRAAAEGAQIGGANLEDTAYALSAAMNALHDSTGDAGKVMGVLNATVGSGDMTMQDLIDAFKSGLIPTADSFGVSITSVGAALAVMGDMGMRGALAGTRLRMALSLLGAPTKQAAGILETLGMSSKDAIASTKAMSNALADAGIHTTTLTADLRKPDGIEVALKDLDMHLRSAGLSAQGAAAVLSRAFGGGRMGAAIALLSENTDRLVKKFDYINQKADMFPHDWRQTSETFRVQLDKALASVEALGIAIGDKLMPYATDFLHWMEDGAKWLLNNKTGFELLGGAVVAFSTVAIGSYFFSKMKAAIGLMQDFGGSIGKFGRWIFGIGPAVAPNASEPAAQIATAITDSSAKGAASMESAIVKGSLRASDAMGVSVQTALAKAGLISTSNVSTSTGAVTGVKTGLATVAGKIWGFAGSDILVGTMRNPIAVTIAGAGLTGGAVNATQAALQRQAGIGPAVVAAGGASTAAETGPQLSLLDANTGKMAASSEEMAAETGRLNAVLTEFVTESQQEFADMAATSREIDAAMTEFERLSINQQEFLDTNLTKLLAADDRSASYAEYMAGSVKNLSGQIDAFGGSVDALGTEIAALPLKFTEAAGAAAVNEQLGLGGLANTGALRGAVTPIPFLPNKYGAKGEIAGLVTAEKSAAGSIGVVPAGLGGLSPLGEGVLGSELVQSMSGAMTSLKLQLATVMAAMRTRIAGALGSETVMGGLGSLGGSIVTDLRSAVSSMMSGLFRGGMMASMGTLISQMVGDAVHGSAGGWIKSLGTGASIGAGAGIIIPGIGPAIGAAIGTAIAGLAHSGALKSILESIFGPGGKGPDGTQNWGGSWAARYAPPSVQKEIAALLNRGAALQYSPGKLTQEANQGPLDTLMAGAQFLGGDLIGGRSEMNQVGLRKMSQAAMAQQLDYYTKAGQLLAQAMEKGWNSEHFQSEPIMFRQFEAAAARMPPAARAAAAESAIHFAQQLEASGRLPLGATQNLISDIEARWPGLVPVLGSTAQAAVATWTKNFDLSKWQSSLQGTLTSSSKEFAAVQFAVSHTSGTIVDKSEAAQKALSAIAKDSIGPMSVAAKKQLDSLALVTAHDLNAMAGTAAEKGQNIAASISDYTTQAATAAAANLNLSDAQTSLVNATQNIINTAQREFGNLGDLTTTTVNTMADNMGTAYARMEEVAKTKTGQAKQEALANIQLLQTNATTLMNVLATKTTVAMGLTEAAIKKGSFAAAAQGAAGFSHFVSSIQTLMADGVIKTSAGMKLILGEMYKALKALGSPIKQSDLAGMSPGDVRGLLNLAGGTAPAGAYLGGGKLGQNYTGGRVPGPVGPDSWYLVDSGGVPRGMVGGGELLVANRHTEDKVNRMLSPWGTTLGAMVAGEGVPHYAASSPPKATTGGDFSSASTKKATTGGGFGMTAAGPTAGKYVSPFGGPVTPERIDQGVDYSMAAGTALRAVGNARVMGVIPDFYAGQPEMWYELLDGRLKGAYIYYAEQIVPKITSGMVSAGQTIATFAPSGTGLEAGFASATGATLAKSTGGYQEGQLTAAGMAFSNFMQSLGVPGGLAEGRQVVGHLGGSLAKLAAMGGGGFAIPVLQVPKWTGPGGLVGMVGLQTLKLVTAAANKKLQQVGMALGGATAGSVAGPLTTASEFVAGPSTASGHTYVPGFAELSNPPSSLNFSALGNLPMGELIEVGYGGKTITIPKIDVGAGGPAIPPASVRGIDLSMEAAAELPGFGGLANVNWRDLHRKAFTTGGKLPYAGAFGTGGIVTVDQPTVALFGDNGQETAIFLPQSAIANTQSSALDIAQTGPSTTHSTSTGTTSTGKPSGSNTTTTSTTAYVGGKEVTTTYTTTTGTSGSHTTVTTTSRPIPTTTGFNPLTDRIETHTAAEWHLIHLEYEKQVHDAAAAKKAYDKYLAENITEMFGIGGIPLGVIEMTRKLAKQKNFPLTKHGGGFLSLLDVGRLTPEGWKTLLTAVHASLATLSPHQAQTLSNTMAVDMRSKDSPIHKLYEEYHDHRSKAEEYRRKAEAAADRRAREHAGAMQAPTKHMREELLREARKSREEAEKYHDDARKQWNKANEYSQKIASSKPGQLEASFIAAAVKGIMDQFTQTQQNFANTSNVLSELESVPAGSTAHTLGLDPTQLRALGITKKEIKKLAGAASGSDIAPFTYELLVKRLVHQEIPADEATVHKLEKQLQDARRAHDAPEVKKIMHEISTVSSAEVKAWTEVSKAHDDFVNAEYQMSQARLANIQQRSNILASIQDLAPGTSLKKLGLTHKVLESMGFSARAIRNLKSMEGSSAAYIQELEQEQNGELTPAQIDRYKRAVAAQNKYLAAQRHVDIKEETKLERELPHLRGQARADAETHIKDLSKNVLDLTNTMRENTKSVKDLTQTNKQSMTSTGQMTGTVGYTYQNQDYVIGGRQTSERLMDVGLG